MKVVLLERQEGKTSQVVEMSAERGGYIVTTSEHEAHRVFREAYDRDVQIPYPLTAYEFMEKKYYGKHIREFYIDNLDLILPLFTTVPIYAVSLTKED